MSFDVFISHASEDKAAVARPLAAHLRALGYRVWFDEFALNVGDSLRRSIDRGLLESRFGIVILSKSFFAKNWPAYELDGLTAREASIGPKVILPLWHAVSHSDVAAYSPTLADRVALVTSLPLPDLAARLVPALGPPSAQRSPLHGIEEGPHNPEQTTAPPDEETCPRCGQKGTIYGYAGSDGDEFAWFECHHCGHFTGL